MTVGQDEALLRNIAFTYGVLDSGAGRRWEIDDDLSLADGGVDFHFVTNMAVVLRSLPARAIADRARAFFGGRPFTIWAMWPLPELAELGFELQKPLSALRREAPHISPRPPSGLEIREATDERSLDLFERTIKDAYGFSDAVRSLRPGAFFPPGALGNPGVRFWIGHAAGRAVGTAITSVSDGVVGVYGVATLPDARRHGYGAALTWAALAARPELPGVLQTSPLGRPVYEAMGFRDVAAFVRWRSIGQR